MPLEGKNQNEYYTIPVLFRTLKTIGKCNLKKNGVYVELKPIGTEYQIHKKKNKILIYDQLGNEIKNKKLEKQLLTYKDNFIIIGNLSLNNIFTVTDCVYYNKDIHNLKYFERRKIYQKLFKDHKTIKCIESIYNYPNQDIKQTIDIFHNKLKNCTLIIKMGNMLYNLNSTTNQMFIYKPEYALSFKILNKELFNKPNEFIYSIAINNIYCGKTNPTTLNLTINTYATISFSNLERYYDPIKRKDWFTLRNAKVLSKSKSESLKDQLYEIITTHNLNPIQKIMDKDIIDTCNFNKQFAKSQQKIINTIFDLNKSDHNFNLQFKPLNSYEKPIQLKFKKKPPLLNKKDSGIAHILEKTHNKLKIMFKGKKLRGLLEFKINGNSNTITSVSLLPLPRPNQTQLTERQLEMIFDLSCDGKNRPYIARKVGVCSTTVYLYQKYYYFV
ncbi:MAG: hypothetical protein ACTSQY_00940 [Candidatus Odinarchaeia archaeon]